MAQSVSSVSDLAALQPGEPINRLSARLVADFIITIDPLQTFTGGATWTTVGEYGSGHQVEPSSVQ